MKRETICHIAAGIVSLFIVVPVTLNLLEREPPFELRDGSTVPDKIERGGEYALKWKIEYRAYDCPGLVYRELVDSQNTIWLSPPVPSLFGEAKGRLPGDGFIVGRFRELPNGVALGRLTIKSTTVLRCNFTHYFWPITTRHPDIVTEVVARQ